jgi:hypothetical protein
MNEIINNNKENELIILYKKKKIYFYNLKTKDKKKIINIWKNTRNQYLTVLNKLKTKKINNKFIPDFFDWEGTSSWWFSLLEFKDTEYHNSWYKKFFLINFIIHYKKNIEISSDDKFINNFIKQNFKKIILNDVYLFRLGDFYFNCFNLLKNIFSHIRNYLIFKILKLFANYTKNLNTDLWCLSLYPANWPISTSRNRQQNDRFFDGFFQKQGILKKKYLLLFCKYQKDKTNFFQDLLDIKKKINNNYLFLDRYISLLDLLKIYISTAKEYFTYLKLKKNHHFVKNFYYKGFDISHIFFEEMEKSFFGFIQNAKYGGLSMKNFLLKQKKNQNFITYGEVIAEIRPLYFFIKKHSIKNKIITFQHAVHSKNKMIVYHNKIDFLNSLHRQSIYNLMPDLYLTQGIQFKKILSEYFPGNIKVVGSLKYDSYIHKIYVQKKISKIVKKKLKIKKNIKIILIAPSTHDADNIFQILKNFKPGNNWTIILSPHPATNHKHLMKYQLLHYPDLKIRYVNDINTIDLVCASEIIISSASSISLEALIFKKISIRFFNLGNVPIFEYEKLIPTFFTSEEFNYWFNNNFKKNNYNSNNKIIKKYFYKIDGKTSQRFDNNLNQLIRF